MPLYALWGLSLCTAERPAYVAVCGLLRPVPAGPRARGSR